MMLATNPEYKFLPNKKTKRHLLDLLTAYVGGFLFVIVVRLFESGAPERSFDLMRQVFYFGRYNSWHIGDHNFTDFIFAFIVTYIIIFIRNQYKKT
jgi:hypothetical protein